MIVPPAAPGDSWLETIDQSPDTSTQSTPRLVLSARLKSSLKVVTTPPCQGLSRLGSERRGERRQREGVRARPRLAGRQRHGEQERSGGGRGPHGDVRQRLAGAAVRPRR